MKTCKADNCHYPVFSNGYCKSHQYKRGKVKPIAKISRKRRKESKAYSQRRAEFLWKKMECEFPDCCQYATDVHHTEGREGSRYLDVSTWKALCRTHHDWAENHPKEAKALGISKSRLNKAS